MRSAVQQYGHPPNASVGHSSSANVTSLRRTLAPLEHVIMEYVWTHPGCSAETCREGTAPQRALKNATIRTILRSLEEKGYVTHEVDGRTFLYRAADSKLNVAVQAIQQVIERFWNGSVEELLVGLVDHHVLESQQLTGLAERIASGKKRHDHRTFS